MSVAISEFQKELFQLLPKAAQGEVVEFTHKGNVFTVTLKKKRNRLDGSAGLSSRVGRNLRYRFGSSIRRNSKRNLSGASRRSGLKV